MLKKSILTSDGYHLTIELQKHITEELYTYHSLIGSRLDCWVTLEAVNNEYFQAVFDLKTGQVLKIGPDFRVFII